MIEQSFSGIGMTSSRTRERLIQRLKSQGIANAEVLERIRSVPRHIFVDEALASRAYEDTALPIGFGQTISQPYIVALMTAALIEDHPSEKRLDRVLEIGCGCGYQTAVLSPFFCHIYSLERIPILLSRAREHLRQLKITNTTLRAADGWGGWESEAPFQGIIVAAAPEDVPEKLLAQLAEGGRLIIPVGNRSWQNLLCITREGQDFRQEILGKVKFVPLLGGMEN